MTTKPKPYVVRVNRLILLAFLAVAALFILAGLDMAVFRNVLDFEVDPEKLWMFYLFVYGICFVLCGGIALQMLWYMVLPPVLLRMDETGLSFGVGFRYKPFRIPWAAVKSVGYGVAVNNVTAQNQPIAGAKVVMKEMPDVPNALATSMGLQYAFRTLHVSALYANKTPRDMVERGKECLQAFGDGAPT